MIHFSEGFGRKGVNGYYSEQWPSIHIHFYGSDHWYDWLIHGLALPYKVGSFWAHMGWSILAKRAFKLLPDLTQFTHIKITGHSLGGAIGQIFAVMLAQKYPELSIDVATFGSPRAWYNCDSIDYIVPMHHWIYGNDQVPWMPFWLSNPGAISQVGNKGLWYKDHGINNYRRLTNFRL